MENPQCKGGEGRGGEEVVGGKSRAGDGDGHVDKG